MEEGVRECVCVYMLRHMGTHKTKRIINQSFTSSPLFLSLSRCVLLSVVTCSFIVENHLVSLYFG